jgi:hypothetical protein
MLDESSVELFLVENFNRGQFRSGRSSLPQE